LVSDDEKSQKVIETIERCADGEVNGLVLREAHAIAEAVYKAGRNLVAKAVFYASEDDYLLGASVRVAADSAFHATVTKIDDSRGDYERASRHQINLMRDIIGNPFPPIALNDDWKTPTVLALAQAAYEYRILPAGTLDAARL